MPRRRRNRRLEAALAIAEAETSTDNRNDRLVEDEKGRIVGHFDSVEDFARHAEWCTKHRAPNASKSSTDPYCASKSWDLGDGWDGTLRKMFDGWPEATKKIRDTVVPLVDKITAQIEQDHYDFVDDGSIASDFDVPTLLTGEPSHWLQHRTEIVEGKGHRIIRIGVASKNTAGVSAEGMYRRGVIAAALAYCLEAAGFGVELVACGLTTALYGGQQYLTYVNVKGAGDVLDLNRVALAVAHGGFQRRLDFAVRESDARLVACGIGTSGYGRSHDLDPSDQESFDIYVPVTCAYVPASELADYVLNELRKQGVKIKGDKEVAA